MANNFANSINSNIGASNSGATNTLTITNPSNTASSQALVNVTVGGATAGDAFTTYTVSGVTNWSEGIDNSASDAFVIAASTALGTTNVLSATTAGAVTKPLQPAFLAVLGTTDTNATGAGTTFMLGSGNALTEIFDQGGNFVTTGTFTAPETGRYQLSFNLIFGALTAAMTFVVSTINTTNRNYNFSNINIGLVRTIAAASDTGCSQGTVLADMDAGDAFILNTAIHGGVGDTASIIAANARIFMSGFLAC